MCVYACVSQCVDGHLNVFRYKFVFLCTFLYVIIVKIVACFIFVICCFSSIYLCFINLREMQNAKMHVLT